jgi:hypothetical protein
MNALVAMEWDTPTKPARRYLSDDELEVPAKAPTPAACRTPAWRRDVLVRLLELTQLKDNWDSYGARRPRVESAAALLAVLNSIMDPETVPPIIVPTPDGHFQAEWHRNKCDLEIEVIDPTRIVVMFTADDVHWEEELSVDFTRLIAVVRRIGGTP